ALLSDLWDLGPRFPPVRIRPLTWTEDPFSDSYWRFLFYSLRPTSNLLWAYYASGETRYRDKLIEILRSYAEHDAARPVGPQAYDRTRFDNRHAAAYRALVLVNTLVKLRRSGDLPPDLEQSLLGSLERLGAFLVRPENFEPGNNHGYTEAAALVVMAENLPELPGAPAWRDLGLRRLEQLALDTIDDDGVQIENSPFYHIYSLCLLWEIRQWAHRFGVPLSRTFSDRVTSMTRYAHLVTQPDGQLPLLGASVSMDVRRYRSDVLSRIAAFDPALAYVRSAGASGQEPSERHALFPSSGHAILRSGFGKGEEFSRHTHILFDVGPYRTLHSHLDGLSLVYYSAGRTLLPDSGLYTYEPGEEFAYYQSTRAHNTVVVDDRDQALGVVRPGLHAGGPEWAYQSGSHHLYPGVLHRRAVLLLQRDLALVVDLLDSQVPHSYAQTWHLFPEARLQQQGLHVIALDETGPVLALHQALGEGVTLEIKKGATAPRQGWYSAIYGKQVASYALEYRVQASTAAFVTLIASGSYAARPVQTAVRRHSDTLSLHLCIDGAGLQAEVNQLAQHGESVTVRPLGPCAP
ncbi:MAG: heparinase II/III family protein, partial [Myxococcota bacterium]|nr:heparinase II/III family protein [Myxococcota bacterium]